MKSIVEGITPFYSDEVSELYYSDVFEALQHFVPQSVDLIFADPPYDLPRFGVIPRWSPLIKEHGIRLVLLNRNIRLTENGLAFVKIFLLQMVLFG